MDESLKEYIAEFSGFSKKDIDEFKCFVSIQSFDSSDHTVAATVRYVNPDNENDWAYDVYVVEDYDQPSLVFMKASRVFSYYKELFNKVELSESFKYL